MGNGLHTVIWAKNKYGSQKASVFFTSVGVASASVRVQSASAGVESASVGVESASAAISTSSVHILSKTLAVITASANVLTASLPIASFSTPNNLMLANTRACLFHISRYTLPLNSFYSISCLFFNHKNQLL